ncbi:hypothetical protein Pelo_18159 [Pelomyxa schiedti]|nr:hypothetical protein Pelo_18159 [Pelomyxa schiedti]
MEMEANSSIMSKPTTKYQHRIATGCELPDCSTSTLLPSVARNIEVEVLAREWHWRMSEAYGKEEGEDKAIVLLFTAPNSLARARHFDSRLLSNRELKDPSYKSVELASCTLLSGQRGGHLGKNLLPGSGNWFQRIRKGLAATFSEHPAALHSATSAFLDNILTYAGTEILLPPVFHLGASTPRNRQSRESVGTRKVLFIHSNPNDNTNANATRHQKEPDKCLRC